MKPKFIDGPITAKPSAKDLIEVADWLNEKPDSRCMAIGQRRHQIIDFALRFAARELLNERAGEK